MRLKFWSNWLAVYGLVCVAGGLAMVFLFGSPVLSPLRNAINHVFWQGPVPDKQTADFEWWISAVLGAVIAGWGLMLAIVARGPFRRGERWAWGAVAWPFTLWYVVDTGASLSYNVTFNAVLNTISFVLLAVPLAATWREFRKEKPAD